MLSNIARPTPVSASDLTKTSTNSSSIDSKPLTQQRTSRTYFRPPGLGPDSGECSDDTIKVCPHCGFSCPSQFHYNSHMNTHTIQQCVICDYQSRTQGRLKKHLQNSHTQEERLAAGVNLITKTSKNRNHSTTTLTIQKQPQNVVDNDNNNKNGNAQNLTNTTTSISNNNGNETNRIESLQSILNNNNNSTTINSSSSTSSSTSQQQQQQFSNSTDALLKICTDAISNNGPNEKSFNSPQIGDLGPTAFDQFRALAERQAANLLATSTANSLGFVVNEIDQEMDEGEISPDDDYLNNNNNGKPETSSSSSRRTGKPKQYKCKQCPHLSHSKKDQWAHARLHIPKQKQLSCDFCDFVTEYKHHLEYHYRNHNGQKPFKCSICSYTCVNKSMLNSHMKSHTPNFQFKCRDCTYQTKYCHSLKMHLKKYNHKRAPGPGGELFDSSDSHGEGAGTPAIGDRPENASSSSASKEESFDNLSNNYLTKSDDLTLLKSPSTPHHHHHDLVVQPLIGNNSDLDLVTSQQHFILQQQIEQMHELICNSIVNCPHCNFSTGNIDEMNQHLFLHLIATHQQIPQQNEQEALASIYHRLTTQLHQELAQSTDNNNNTSSSTLLSQELPAAAAALQINQGGLNNNEEEEENNLLKEKIQENNNNEDNNLNKTKNEFFIETKNNNNIMDISSNIITSSPSCPTFNNNNELIERDEEEEMIQQQNKIEKSPTTNILNCEGIIKPIPSLFSPSLTNNQFSSMNQNDNNSSNNLGGSTTPSPNNNNNFLLLNKNNEELNNDSTLPFYCQQCDIAFRDAVLYQLHRGYHSIENPFKCNRCGNISNTALEFNLHLYQAKHE